MRNYCVALATIFLASACAGRADANCSLSNSSTSAALTPLHGCDAAQTAVKQAAIAAMNKTLDASLQSYLENGRCYPDAVPVTAVAVSSAGSPGASSSTGASQVSHTNNQVAGVDEADFVKNDNQYIYTVTNNGLHIVQAWPAATAHEVSRTAIDGTPLKLFVQNNRALVYTSIAAPAQPVSENLPFSVSSQASDCTYGYDCDVGGDGSATRILIFDLTNPAAPQLLRTVNLSGSFIAARRIGNAVHTVVANPGIVFPELSTWPMESMGAIPTAWIALPSCRPSKPCVKRTSPSSTVQASPVPFPPWVTLQTATAAPCCSAITSMPRQPRMVPRLPVSFHWT